jgi:hypothetical protein
VARPAPAPVTSGSADAAGSPHVPPAQERHAGATVRTA